MISPYVVYESNHSDIEITLIVPYSKQSQSNLDNIIQT